MHAMTGKERCLAAIRSEPVDRIPVFPLLMMLATDRAGITYRRYATDANALADAQLAVLEQFKLDAITACSDAFRVSADLGGAIVFPEDTPPFLERPLIEKAGDLQRLIDTGCPDPREKGSRMADRIDAVEYMAKAVGEETLVLGWVDLPFAEACSACGVGSFMMTLHDDPDLARGILDFLADVVIDFALAQIEAGAAMVGAGDAAASLISPAMYREFALPYEKRVFSAIRGTGGLSKLHICGDTNALLPMLPEAGADLYNVDHMVDLATARDVYGSAGVCFKGNLDPVADMLQETPDGCAVKAVTAIQAACGTPRPAYMLSPGCEIPAATTDEVLQAFCTAPDILGEA